jgi:hypothetical protein
MRTYTVRYLWAHPVVLMIIASVLSFPTSMYAQPAVRIKIVAHSETRGIPQPHTIEPVDRTTTIYAQSSRTRIESAFRHMVIIQRCDIHVMYVLNPTKREYTESLLPSPEQQSKAAEDAEQKRADNQPNLSIETRTVNTGETKAAFGHTARHYITTTKQTPSPELGQQPSETVVDAWYLDFPDVRTCQPVSLRSRGLIGDPTTIEKVRPELRYSGPEPQGLVFSEKRTSHSVHVLATGEKRDLERTSSYEIVEMSEVPIDPALFEVPPGFTKVEKITQ